MKHPNGTLTMNLEIVLDYLRNSGLPEYREVAVYIVLDANASNCDEDGNMDIEAIKSTIKSVTGNLRTFFQIMNEYDHRTILWWEGEKA